MKLLLDTRILLWAAQGVKHLPLDAQTLMNDPENELLFSVASLWEIVIKLGWLYPEKAQRLPGGDLWDFEDTQGLIWVSSSVGLSMYDKSVNAFAVYRHDPDDPKSIGEGTAILAMQSIAEDANGNIWYGTQKGLNRYEKQTKAFTVYTHNPSDPNSLGNNNVTALWADKQAAVWVGTEGGLDKLNPSTGVFTH